MNKFVAGIAVFAMLVAMAFAAYTPNHNKATFESWLLQNERDYSNVYANNFDSFEFELRRQIFTANMETIRAHNARYEQGLETWFMKPTQFADLTEAEFEAKHLGFDKSSPTKVHRLQKLNKNLKIDNFVPIDWSNIMPDVVNQGSCGSCWANAAATVLGGYINKEFGKSSANYPSRQQLNSCTENPRQCGGSGGCNGSTANLAFAHLVKSGVATEADYTYTSGSGSTGTCKEALYQQKFRISGYDELKPNDRQALYDALKVGPVSVSAYASGWSFYGGGIFTKCAQYDVNHAISLTAMGEDNGKYFFKIMNSWGAGWGEQGSMRLHMAPPTEDEECGIDKSPYDGSACKDDPNPRVEACACNGLLYDSVVPTGITKV